MNLTSSQRNILAHLTQMPNASAKAVAARAKVREYSVRYAIQHFLKLGWVQPVYMINPMPLGLRPFNIFFSVNSRRSESVIKILASDPRVGWVTEQTGNPRYEVTVLIKDPFELAKLLDQVGREARVAFDDREWAVETGYYYYGERYLGVNSTEPIHVAEYNLKENYKADRLDLAILDQLRGSHESRMAPVSELARKLKHAQTTVAYRVEQLSRARVLSPKLFLLDPEKAGLSQYQVVVNLRSMDRNVHEELLDFCGTQPSVTTLIKGFGGWDYKMVVQGESADDGLQVRDQFERRFGDAICEIQLLARRRIISTHFKLSGHPELAGVVDR